jgi:hypothetical protein
MLTWNEILLVFAIAVRPHVGQAPLDIRVEARPPAVGYVCVQAESNTGGWHQHCWQQEDGSPALHSFVLRLDEDGEWTVVLRRGTAGQVEGKAKVLVTPANPPNEEEEEEE